MNELTSYWRKLHARENYKEITTPTMMSRSLWETSGHWDHYKDNMYTTKVDETDYAIKPMNCPGAMLVYKNDIHSYRELPLRLSEMGHVHRHEASGALMDCSASARLPKTMLTSCSAATKSKAK